MLYFVWGWVIIELKVTPPTPFLKTSRVGDSTTCLVSEFLRRMVFVKRKPFSRFGWVDGTRRFMFFPLVNDLVGMSMIFLDKDN